MFFGASGPSRVSLSWITRFIAATVYRGLAGRPTKGRPRSTSRPRAVPVSWKRIAAWHRLRHMDPAQMPMRVVTYLWLQTQAAELREAIEKTGVHAVSDIIIDTLARLPGEENSSTRSLRLPRHR